MPSVLRDPWLTPRCIHRNLSANKGSPNLAESVKTSGTSCFNIPLKSAALTPNKVNTLISTHQQLNYFSMTQLPCSDWENHCS